MSTLGIVIAAIFLVVGAISVIGGYIGGRGTPRGAMKAFGSLLILVTVSGLVLTSLNVMSFGGQPTYSIPGAPATPGDAPAAAPVVSGQPKIISSLRINSVIAGSNARGTATGLYNIYEAGTNPKDPLATTIDYGALSGGTCTTTNSSIFTNTAYRAAYNGEDTYYSKDFGDIVISTMTSDSSTVSDVITIGGIQTIGSFGDLIDESSITAMNGQNNTNVSEVYSEIGCAGSGWSNCTDGSTIIYDESQGDGDFYLLIDIQCDGSTEFCANTVLAFVAESTTVGPEWNEFSSITVSHVSGSAIWPAGKSDITNYFDRGQPTLNLGDLTGGQSETLRFTFNVVESATDTNDDFLIIVDDLGAVGGLDPCRNGGASSVQIDIDFQA